MWIDGLWTSSWRCWSGILIASKGHADVLHSSHDTARHIDIGIGHYRFQAISFIDWKKRVRDAAEGPALVGGRAVSLSARPPRSDPGGTHVGSLPAPEYRDDRKHVVYIRKWACIDAGRRLRPTGGHISSFKY